MKATIRIVPVLALSACMCALPNAQEQTTEAFQGEAIERFLATARVIAIEPIGMGITDPDRVTLELDGVTHDAVYKDIDDEPRPGGTEVEGGFIASLQDSYRLEIAAYVVDRIIGLGMVPATIKRRIRGYDGSLQWWVDSKMTEAGRIKQGIDPPDRLAWNQEVLKLRLFDRLIYNIDRNLDNLLITETFEIRLIDHSRSFQNFARLRNPEQLTMFSRSLLKGLERLEYEDLKERLGEPNYLLDGQIRALLERRDLILELAEQRVAELGEEAVLYK
jgi:hypothetical protein